MNEPIHQYTDLLHRGDEPFWRRLRECLNERGLDPRECVLADSFEDADCFEFGVLIAPGERVIEFGFSYPRGDIAGGEVTEWRDITDRWRDTPNRAEVERGFALLAQWRQR